MENKPFSTAGGRGQPNAVRRAERMGRNGAKRNGNDNCCAEDKGARNPLPTMGMVDIVIPRSVFTGKLCGFNSLRN